MKRTAIRPVNRKRKGDVWRAAFHSPERVEWMQGWGCSVPHCLGRPIEVAHARSRGAGGTWRDTLPLCQAHHRAQHTIGVATFERTHGIDMTAKAAEFVVRWDNGDLAF